MFDRVLETVFFAGGRRLTDEYSAPFTQTDGDRVATNYRASI
jgi:hypothetical protein